MSREIGNYRPLTLPATAPAPQAEAQQQQALASGASTIASVQPHDEKPVKTDVKSSFYEELKVRLAKGEKPSEAMLDEAIQRGSKSSIKLLVRKGVDLDRPGVDGNTRLHNACKTGDAKAVKLLLACGASIHATNAEFVPPVVSAFDLPKEALRAVLREIAVARPDGAQRISAWALHLDRHDILAWLMAEKLMHPSMIMHYYQFPAEFLTHLDKIFEEASNRHDHGMVANCVEVLCHVIAWREPKVINPARKLLESWEKRAGDTVVEAYAHKRANIQGYNKLQPFDEEIETVTEYKTESVFEVGEITFTPHQ